MESQQQPVWHVLVLGGLTGSVYLLYWVYRTWKLLKAESANPDKLSQHKALSLFAKINPGLRTLALLAPFLIVFIPFMAGILKTIISDAIVIYLLATLVVGVASLIPEENSFPRKHPLLACGVVISAGLMISAVAKVPGGWYMFSLILGALPCGIVQHWLNKYWKAVEPNDVFVRYGFNGPEMVAIIIGASLIGLNAAGLMIGVKPPTVGAGSL